MQIVRCHQITSRLHAPVHETIISIVSFMRALQALKPLVFSNLQSQSEFRAERFEFRHHAVCDTRDAFCIETVHHALDQVQFILDAKVDEICIDQDAVRWMQGLIELEKERTGDLGDFTYQLAVCIAWSRIDLFGFGDARVFGADETLCRSEFASLFGLCHALLVLSI